LNKYLKNVTNSQLADGVDKFYSDYRNRRIMVNDAVWLVLNEISGKSDADMKKMIENWRKSPQPMSKKPDENLARTETLQTQNGDECLSTRCFGTSAKITANNAKR